MSSPKHKITKKFMIDYLVDQVNNWEIDFLIQVAQILEYDRLKKMKLEDIQEEYKEYTEE